MSPLAFLLQSRGMGVVNACAVSMGLLCDLPLVDWHPAPQEIKEACKAAVEYCKVSLTTTTANCNMTTSTGTMTGGAILWNLVSEQRPFVVMHFPSYYSLQ